MIFIVLCAGIHRHHMHTDMGYAGGVHELECPCGLYSPGLSFNNNICLDLFLLSSVIMFTSATLCAVHDLLHL